MSGTGLEWIRGVDIDFETGGQETSFETGEIGYQVMGGVRWDFARGLCWSTVASVLRGRRTSWRRGRRLTYASVAAHTGARGRAEPEDPVLAPRLLAGLA